MSCINEINLNRFVGGANVEGSKKLKRNIAQMYFNIFTMN